MALAAKARQGRRSFLKKRTKKLLILSAMLPKNAVPNSQKFFVSFFQKRNTCFFLILEAPMGACRRRDLANRGAPVLQIVPELPLPAVP